MAIFLDSRYLDGPLFKVWDQQRLAYHLTVFREWPTVLADYFWYTWTSSDRLDILANTYLGSSNRWYEIMDINPEIANPWDITPGTSIRIPNA